MIIGSIRGANLTLVAPGCSDLRVRADVYEDGTTTLTSAWMPTPDELKRLNEGLPIHLSIYGTGKGHPPVLLSVPED